MVFASQRNNWFTSDMLFPLCSWTNILRRERAQGWNHHPVFRGILFRVATAAAIGNSSSTPSLTRLLCDLARQRRRRNSNYETTPRDRGVLRCSTGGSAYRYYIPSALAVEVAALFAFPGSSKAFNFARMVKKKRTPRSSIPPRAERSAGASA